VAHDDPYGLLIPDVLLPGKDGFEVCKVLARIFYGRIRERASQQLITGDSTNYGIAG
jgi:DNA-binding response OmpR family regulator